MGSLIGGGGCASGFPSSPSGRMHMPVLNGSHSRANSLAGLAATSGIKPAGAPIPVQSRSRGTAEMRLERKHKAAASSLESQYDAYLDACEDHTFAKLHANLARMERKAEREHNMLNGAAGVSAEKRRERADAKIDMARRDKSPARFHGVASSRQGNYGSDSSSIASLLKQPDVDPYARQQQQQQQQQHGRSGSPAHVPRLYTERVPGAEGDVPMTDRSTNRSARASSPFRGGEGPQVPRRAASPRGPQRASSPRRAASPRAPPPPRGRDASPFRQRPE